jgi:hypothetical protein
MRFVTRRTGHIAAVAAALVIALAAGFGSDSHAQFLPKDKRGAQKNAPPVRGPVQPPRKGFANPALGPNRMAVQPRGPMSGPGHAVNRGLPNNRAANFGPNNRLGAGNRLGNQPRGFTHRAPHLRAVNAATPQMRQVQRVTHRSEMFAWRNRMPRYPLPGDRNPARRALRRPKWSASGGPTSRRSESRRSRASMT